jgi:hypothetical protein
MILNEEEIESLTVRRDIRIAKERHKNNEMGLKRPCILRELEHFDVGKSFVVDSLHNIYLGVFVSFTENLFFILFYIETSFEPVV